MKQSVVAIVRCDSYKQQEVRAAIDQGIALLGGINKFIINKDEKLLLKPNVLSGVDPERCVVTHPSVFEAVVSLFKENGAHLSYGDSSADLSGVPSALKKAGITEIAEKYSVPLAEFEKGTMVTFNRGVAGKKLYIANAILSCDGVISLPKLKTHGLTRMTGAVKNQYGCIPGLTKGDYHARFPDVYEFSKLIADITSYISPRLYIMDAIYAMEGNGPQSGTPKKLGLLLFSTDPVAIDTVACKIIDLDPAFVPTIDAGVKIGLGVSSDDLIELKGEPISMCIDHGFDVVRLPPVRVPRNKMFLEIRSHFIPRPVASHLRCIRCGRCVKVCPVDPKAITLKKNAKKPSYNYRRCIRCFCCQEVCPAKAISIQNGILKRLFPYASYLSLLLSNVFAKTKKRAPV